MEKEFPHPIIYIYIYIYIYNIYILRFHGYVQIPSQDAGRGQRETETQEVWGNQGKELPLQITTLGSLIARTLGSPIARTHGSLIAL